MIIQGINLYLQDEAIDSSKLKFSFAEEKDGFPMDAIKVAMAVGNLIDNAFKYPGNFSKVLVSTKISDDENIIKCCVEDNGNGIPLKDLDRIFERFYVVDKGRSRKKGGTVQGLSIVKHVAEAHGGFVHHESIPNKRTVSRLVCLGFQKFNKLNFIFVTQMSTSNTQKSAQFVKIVC